MSLSESKPIKAPPVPLYELNLAEFPLFFLSKSPAKGQNSIKYSDTITISGKPVKRDWLVTWSPEFGVPSPAVQETFFALFQIWKEAEFASPIINFGTFRSLLMRRSPGRRPGQLDYQQLARSLDVLHSIYVTSKNAFYDITKKKHIDIGFHLFESNVFFKDSPDLPDENTTGIVRASDFLHGAVLNKSLFPLNISERTFYKLTPLQRRILLYLKKILYRQTVNRRALLEFARQLPISTRSIRKVRQEIKNACQALIDASLLPGLHLPDFYKSEDGTDMVQFTIEEATQVDFSAKLGLPSSGPERQEIIEEIERITGDRRSRGNFALVVDKMDYWNDIKPVLSDVEAAMREGSKFKPGALFTTWIKQKAAHRGIVIYTQDREAQS
jgi:hypothetical protein